MKSLFEKGRTQLLALYFYGSLAVLLVCLSISGLLFSTTFLKKEEERAKIYSEQMGHFFEFEYRKIAEEMYTGNFPSIAARVGVVAKELGNANYDLILADDTRRCVYSSQSQATTTDCSLTDSLREGIQKFRPTTDYQPVLKFDEKTGRYIYVTPLYVGTLLKGYLHASLSDPYQFYRGNRFVLAIRLFSFGFLFIFLAWCLWLILSRAYILKPYLKEVVELEKREALGDLVAHVAHDISAPLKTLENIAKGQNGLPPRQAQLFNTAAARMRSIIKEILALHKNPQAKQSFTLVSDIVYNIVAEKQAALPDDSRIEIKANIAQDSTLVGVTVFSGDLARALANLLSNSVDAIKNEDDGKIQVSLTRKDSTAVIAVEDNGIGIRSDLLQKIRSDCSNISDKLDGHGLGLKFVKKTAVSVGGTFSIKSAVGKGTKVTLELPLALRPSWCASHITINKDDKVLVLDDDDCARLLWQNRLSGRDVQFIKDPEEFDLNRFPPHQYRYIFDYHFTNNPVTGLDLARTNGLRERAVLATSHFNDPKVQLAVKECGMTMIPKFLISEIEIREAEKFTETLENQSYDLVLIDDDSMFHDWWQLKAEELSRNILTVFDEKDLERLHVNKGTPVYVDWNLFQDDHGLEVAELLHGNGFTNLYIATSGDTDADPGLSFVKGVVGKDFPLSAC